MSDDSAFFEELQGDFLNESAFMLEQYEEYMMNLENSNDPVKHLTDIFRVAHSIKGGAAAVGFTDLSKFGHVMEDLLDLLRSKTELVSSEAISLLLKSGDELKNRIGALQQGVNEVWDPSELQTQLVNLTHTLGGKAPAAQAVAAAPVVEEKLEMAPDDFFDVPVTEVAATPEGADSDDVTNHDLLAELLSQLSPEDQAEFFAKEEAEAQIKAVKNEMSILQAVKTEPASTPVVAVAAPVAKIEPLPAAPVASIAKTPSDNNSEGKSPKTKLTSVIKVDTGRVDSVLDAVGELVVIKNLLVHDETVTAAESSRLAAVVDQLDKAVRELYEKTLSIRMTPLKSMFVKIQRLVRDVSLNLDKPVDLQLIGEETEVERTVFELLGDPMVHLVRNSMDHGVENREKRLEAGKPATAKVTVSAKQSGGNVIIDIIDDGGGINRDRVLNKAIERGFVPADVDPSSIPDETVFQYIFYPGFSTAEKISDLSGRGVGLDVVKSNLDKIQGKINIYSKSGKGTTFRLTIPLSTAITDGIIVSLYGERYILPIHSICEIVRIGPEDYTDISRAGRVANIRGTLLPVIDARKFLGQLSGVTPIKEQSYSESHKSLSDKKGETMLVIVESITGKLAFPVDDVLGQAQVVVKPVSIGYDIPEVAGAAVLGDGKTVLILDPNALTRTHEEVAA